MTTTARSYEQSHNNRSYVLKKNIVTFIIQHLRAASTFICIIVAIIRWQLCKYLYNLYIFRNIILNLNILESQYYYFRINIFFSFSYKVSQQVIIIQCITKNLDKTICVSVNYLKLNIFQISSHVLKCTVSEIFNIKISSRDIEEKSDIDCVQLAPCATTRLLVSVPICLEIRHIFDCSKM